MACCRIFFLGKGIQKMADIVTDKEKWEFLSSTKDDLPVSRFYNVGVQEVFANVVERTIITLTLTIVETDAHGILSPTARQQLQIVDEALFQAIAAAGAHYLGRITWNGSCKVYVLAEGMPSSLAVLLKDKAVQHGYDASVVVAADPQLETYWSVLVPTPEDRRIEEEMRRIDGDVWVLNNLFELGDVASISREVEHCAYFPSRETADLFVTWSTHNAFTTSGVELRDDLTMPYQVHVQHEGTMEYEDIMPRTMQIHRQARTLGGTYDGWETFVMRGD